MKLAKQLVLFFLILFSSKTTYTSYRSFDPAAPTAQSAQNFTISTIYGTCTIQEPVIIELIKSPIMERLKYINQYGLDYYVVKPDKYTRFEHSLGVFYLLRKFGAPLAEQIAGLLHDASHTVFSHVGDFVFDGHQSTGDSYQDTHHETLLAHHGVQHILQKYSLTLQDINHKNPQFKCLEQSLPDLCADRLEYNLYGGHLENLITQQDINEILSDLHFNNETWFFNNKEIAKKFAAIPLLLINKVWASPQELFIDHCAAQVLNRLVELKELSYEDINFSTDDHVWSIMNTNDDPVVQKYMYLLKNYKTSFTLTDSTDFDIHIPIKFRGVDPLVQTQTGLQRLTQLDSDFKTTFEQAKTETKRGWYIKIIQ